MTIWGYLDRLELTNGTCVSLQGRLVPPPEKATQHLELQVSTCQILGPSNPDTYPLAKSRTSFEHLRGHLHLRHRARTFAAVARVRSQAVQEMHAFFARHAFLLTHTPILTSHDCEGGGEVFSVITPETKSSSPAVPFFGSPAYLTVSGQLHLELMAASLGRVYTLGPTFRAEPSYSTRHLAEFWMVEAELTFLTSLDQLLDFIQAFIVQVTRQLCHPGSTCSEDFAFFHRFVDANASETLRVLAAGDYARITYTEAIQLLQKAPQVTTKDKEQKMETGTWTYPPVWGRALQSEHERYLADVVFKRPVFITRYPRECKPFYMKPTALEDKSPEDEGDTVECTDLIVPGMGELVGGSLRIDDHATLLASLRAHGLDEREYGWYLDLRKYGSAPHGGFGMGFERYLSLITGMKNIKDVIPVPRYAGSIKY